MENSHGQYDHVSLDLLLTLTTVDGRLTYNGQKKAKTFTLIQEFAFLIHAYAYLGSQSNLYLICFNQPKKTLAILGRLPVVKTSTRSVTT